MCVDCIFFMSATGNQAALRDIIERGKLKCTGQSLFKLERVENPKGRVHCGEQQFDNCHDKMVGEIDYYTGCAREMDDEDEPHFNGLYVSETDRELLEYVME